jgi:hypothetical protein
MKKQAELYLKHECKKKIKKKVMNIKHYSFFVAIS